MKRKRKARRRKLIVILVVSHLLGFACTALWWRFNAKKTFENNYLATQELLSNRLPHEALDRIRDGQRTKNERRLSRWLDLEIEAHRQLGNVSRLLTLFDRTPDAFAANESAALLVARALLSVSNEGGYATLRKSWVGREERPESWFMIEADELIGSASPEEAIQLLQSQVFGTPADSPRLIRLAILTANDDRRLALDYLDQAYEADPQNPEVRSFRAQILERVGKNDRAEAEYNAAHLVDPDNPLYRDQLAEYYRRNEKYPLALQTWEQGTRKPSADFIWFKAAVWSRLIQPLRQELEPSEAPAGSLKPLVEYVLALEPDEFWDREAFERLPESRRYERERQEVFWLRLVSLLQAEEENEAKDLIVFSDFHLRSWQPDLELALWRILSFRDNGDINPAGGPAIPPARDNRIDHSLFKELESWSHAERMRRTTDAAPPELVALFRSEEAFAAAFLAAGWLEAALQLRRLETVPDDFPGWVAYGMTQAFRQNRGNAAALAYAERQPKTPALEVLIGELLLADEKVEEGMARLAKWAQHDSDAGFRAAWLLGVANIDLGRPDETERVVRSQPRLAESVTGQELIARIAVIRGEDERAIELYRALVTESIEAKAYLARKAYAEKDWSTARKLTEELMDRLPANPQLEANLQAIENAENAG